MSRLGMLLLLAFALAVGSGLGCYTMIRHPAVAIAMDDTAPESCADCHAGVGPGHGSGHLWTDPYYTGYYSYYPQDWGWYYTRPWWHDGHGWPYPPGDGTGAPVETQGRHAWDRGPGSPYVPPVGGSRVSPTPTKGNTPAPTTPPPPNDTDSEQQERKKKADEEKKKRNAWGR